MKKFQLVLQDVVIFCGAFFAAMFICVVIAAIFNIQASGVLLSVVLVISSAAGFLVIELIKSRQQFGSDSGKHVIQSVSKYEEKIKEQEEEISRLKVALNTRELKASVDGRETPTVPEVTTPRPSLFNVRQREDAVLHREQRISRREGKIKKQKEDVAQLKADLDTREKDLEVRAKQFEDYQQKTRRQLINDSNINDKTLETIERYLEILVSTEKRTLDWVKLREAEDIDVMNELLELAQKPDKYPVREMTGIEFETYVAEILKNNGFSDVTVTPPTGDYGADVIAKMAGATYIFQCKYYSSPVGIAAVQQIYSAKEHYNAHVAVVVTNNIFTKEAQIMANESSVILWDCETLAKMEAVKAPV